MLIIFNFLGLCQSANDVIIKPDQLKLKRAILFECLGFINLENLNIIHDVGFAVQVCQKLLRIHNCVIKSGGLATTKGIVVLSGCSCEIENSELEGLGTGIMVQKGAVVKITNTRIHNCYEGIKVILSIKKSSSTVKCIAINFCFFFPRLFTNQNYFLTKLISHHVQVMACVLNLLKLKIKPQL